MEGGVKDIEVAWSFPHRGRIIASLSNVSISMVKFSDYSPIPTAWVGPIQIKGEDLNDSVRVPLATYETPLWPSVNRGARVSRQMGGIQVTLHHQNMTRSITVEAPSAREAIRLSHDLQEQTKTLTQVVESTSRFALFKNISTEVVGRLLMIRLSIQTGDASGHNMVTQAAEHLQTYLLNTYPTLRYVSISGNVCVDKKVSAVNGILGRGKHVTAEIIISKEVCKKYLRTTPEALHALNIKKNWVGSTMAGSLRSANAHYANMLLAAYLATGQDAANIVEGSQGMTYTDLVGDALYFSVNLPNLIVGTVGNGKDLPVVQTHLKALGCLEPRETGKNAERLACIIAATVLCGELSLLAAQTNPGELMESHTTLERQKKAQEKKHDYV